MKKLFLLIFILLFSGPFIQSNINAQQVLKYNPSDQNFEQQIDIDDFKPEILRYLIQTELNQYRRSLSVDHLQAEELLTNAANNLAGKMTEDAFYKIEDPFDVIDLFVEEGGTENITFLTSRFSTKVSGEYYTYKTLASDIVDKWIRSAKQEKIAKNQANIFTGISAGIDEFGKKIYISVLFGNYRSYNPEENRLEELEFPITEKSMGLSPYDEKLCRKIEKYNLVKLQEGLSDDDGTIYFETNDLKAFKKIIKKDSRDGLAIDIVQKEQFSCSEEIAINYNLPNRGILTKPMLATKMWAMNEYEDKEARDNLKVELGYIPDGLEDYELHLVIIKDKTFCKSIAPGFLPEKGFKPYSQIAYLADTIVTNSEIMFYPEAVDDEFLIRLPFKDGKSNFKLEDLQPYLDEFKVPPFVIKELNIAAFTSIDQSSNQDMIKINNKSESIVEAFQSLQDEKIQDDILSSNGWTLFRDDVIGTKYDPLAFLDYNEAVREIQSVKSESEMQRILEGHRFASIQLRVIYDIRGANEQEYVIHHFNKAIEKEDLPLALSIQKYIMKSVLDKKYTQEAVIKQRIPLEAEFSGLIMNKLWLQGKTGALKDDQFDNTLKKIHEMDPNNPYITFNFLNNKINNDDFTDDYSITRTQSAIDKLYGTTVGDKTVDQLNLDFQFRMIKILDGREKPSDLLPQRLDRIKAIVNLKANTWQNSLQLAYLFINHEDYKFALNLLEQFAADPNVNEDLLFTYISLSSYTDYKYMTSSFEKACAKALEINNKRFCKLIKKNKLSVSIFENPNMKALYCKQCQ